MTEDEENQIREDEDTELLYPRLPSDVLEGKQVVFHEFRFPKDMLMEGSWLKFKTHYARLGNIRIRLDGEDLVVRTTGMNDWEIS